MSSNTELKTAAEGKQAEQQRKQAEYDRKVEKKTEAAIDCLARGISMLSMADMLPGPMLPMMLDVGFDSDEAQVPGNKLYEAKQHFLTQARTIMENTKPGDLQAILQGKPRK